MCTTGTPCRRRGISSILGTLIFVSIIFSSFIPMMLVMKQANTMYDMRKHELEILDQERFDEEISYYAYPDDNDKIVLRIRNDGNALIKIVSVLINDVEYPHDVNIKSMETKSLDPLTIVDLQDSTYNVKVITEKGNIFTSISSTLYYSGGIWYTPSLGISVHIINNIKGKYEITITKDTETVGYYESQSTDWGEVIKTFMVDDSGLYAVTIKILVGNDLIELFDSPVGVLIDWPPVNPGDGPISHIYVEGDKLKT